LICNLVVISLAKHRLGQYGDYHGDVSSYKQPQQWETRNGMGRFALALTGIMLLILSAGLTGSQSQAASLGTNAPSAAFYDNTDAFRAELMLIKRAALHPATQQSAVTEPPAPALLVYLVLILVGSAGSVALARWRLHG
jgi:hypothetical protein